MFASHPTEIHPCVCVPQPTPGSPCQDKPMKVDYGPDDKYYATVLKRQAALFREAAEMTKPLTDKVSSHVGSHHSYDVSKPAAQALVVDSTINSCV